MICAPWLVNEHAEKSTSRILGAWFKCRQRTRRTNEESTWALQKKGSYYRVLHHQSDYSLDENEPMICIWQYPFSIEEQKYIHRTCCGFTWARIVKSFRRNGRPSSSSRNNSVVIRRLSLICVDNFESNSFDWNNGGRFEADDARFNVRRSATKIDHCQNRLLFNGKQTNLRRNYSMRNYNIDYVMSANAVFYMFPVLRTAVSNHRI